MYYYSVDVTVAILAGAFWFDAVFGEFPALAHPVVWIGRAVSFALRIAPACGWWRQFLFGACLAIAITSLAVLLGWTALRALAPYPVLQALLGMYLLKASFAVRALGQAAEDVLRPLERGDLSAARAALRSLCSRDPNALDEEGLLAATIQSVAENASDSIVAPFFYFAIFGVPGALGYRAINTLDAMVGYRGQYEALGKASARLDDLANWLPARLTAVLLLLAGWRHRHSVRHGWRIARRDHGNTPSPNGGWPMAAMAGLLEVRLEKRDAYALGDSICALTIGRARTACELVRGAAGFTFFAVGMVTLAAAYYGL